MLENEILYGETFDVPEEALDKDFLIPIGKAKVGAGLGDAAGQGAASRGILRGTRKRPSPQHIYTHTHSQQLLLLPRPAAGHAPGHRCDAGCPRQDGWLQPAGG